MKKYIRIFAFLAIVVSSFLRADVDPALSAQAGTIDLLEVFNSCPVIYGLLLLMSVAATSIWIYSIITLRLSDMMPDGFIQHLRGLLNERQFDAALAFCTQENNFSSKIIASGILNRKYGPQVMMDAMQLEGRRYGNILWQRISLLNEISIVAPMLGLLGTVIGLFFAFYDSNRTAESITSIFDGLGIAIGTTVVGLIVALLAMVFYTTLKFRVVSLLNTVENESLLMVPLIQTDHS